MRTPLVAALTALTLTVTACSGGSDGNSDASCPPIEEGMTLAQIKTVVGRAADSTERYGDPDNTTGHSWYFGDDDELIVQTVSGQVSTWAWHDGDQFMEDTPTCPLGER